ncbi:MAG: transglycosylase SLT domain-containing protein, partial [Desulfofustis sp.]
SVQRDFVRVQFLKGWQLLSGIFRKHLLQNPAQASLGYLSFITAGDALKILDELGPAFGVEISRNGLIRLAKIVGGESVELHYAPGINKALQRLFDIDSEDGDSPPAEPAEPDTSPETSFFQMLHHIEDLVLPAAHAAALPSFSEIKTWQPPGQLSKDYIGRIRKLLNTAVTSLVVRKQHSDQLHKIYRHLIPAIAWQESCFKQFVVKDQKLTYLISYNNSSVGLMQVNERVWRGMYDIQRLRWDISYNASTGSDIADLYVQRYVMPKYGKQILSKPELLSQLVYAMYNGGPTQYEKFLKRSKSGKLYDSDRLFAQKYEWVRDQAWEQTSRCF